MATPQIASRAMRRPQPFKYAVLPCLYDTPTIRRLHSEFVTSRETSLFMNTAARRGSEGRPTTESHANFSTTITRTADSHDRGSWRPPSRFDGNEHASSTPNVNREYQPRTSNARRFRKRSPDNDIPFELPEGAQKPPIPAVSTISANERKAFERLHKIAAAKLAAEKAAANTPQHSSVRDHDWSGTLDELLDEAMEDIDEERREHLPTLISARERSHSAVLERVTTLFQAATTDFDLWKVLEKEALEPIAALNLDKSPGPDASLEKVQKEGAKPRDLLMHTFPLLLVEACKTLHGYFPMSPLLLSIIPTLKHLGPSVYALGASTALYNEIMGYNYRTLNDFDGILALLQEMENEALEPDRKTLHILNAIGSVWLRVQRGEHGYAAKKAWEADRYIRVLGRIMGWRDRIQTTLKEDEARRLARERERADQVEEEFDKRTRLVYS